MKIKTSELIGTALDWAVAKCEAVKLHPMAQNGVMEIHFSQPNGGDSFSPSTDWAQGGPIIEREEISISREFTSAWAAWASAPIRDEAEAFGYGPTPLIAAMHCYVQSKLGDEVEVPDEVAA
jgi:hypothetical protein